MENRKLEELYQQIEAETLTDGLKDKTARLFHAMRDDAHRAGQNELAQICQIEMDVFNFEYKDGEILPMAVVTRADGVEVKIPDFAEFSHDESALDYIEKRLQATRNPLLQSSYASLLWHSSRKRQCYAKMAYESNLRLIADYQKKEANQDGYSGLEILNAIVNAYHYAKMGRMDMTMIQREIRKLLDEFPAQVASSFALKRNLLELVLNNRKDFGKELFTSGAGYCMRIITQSELDPHSIIDLLLLGQKFDGALENETINWNNLIAEQYERLLESAIKLKNLSAQTFWQQAIDYYKRGSNSPKVKELDNRYQDVQNTILLGTVEKEMDMKEIFEEYDSIASKIANCSSEFIITYLSASCNLLPNLTTIKKQVDDLPQNTPLVWLMAVEPIDQYGHVTEHFNDDEERYKFHVLEYYNLLLMNFEINLIHRVINAAFKSGKLTKDAILNHFIQRSWFGSAYSCESIPGHLITFDWVALLDSPLDQYFKMLAEEKFGVPNYHSVLMIDSLTPKFEGLLREMIRLSGNNVFIIKHDQKHRPVTRMKTLDELLREPFLEKLFSIDDLFFIKYLLVEHVGMTLRHQVSHCLINKESYYPYIAHLLFLALLKIAKFGFSLEKEAEPPSNETV